jgi:hypothetical protein
LCGGVAWLAGLAGEVFTFGPELDRRGLFSTGPQIKRVVPTRRGPGSALPAGIGVDDGEAEHFEFNDQLFEPAVVVEEDLVVVELLL